MKYLIKLSLLFISLRYINSMCVITVSTGTLRCTQESLEKGSEDYPHHKDSIKEYRCIKCDGDVMKADYLTFPNANIINLSNKIKKLNSDSLSNLNALTTLDLSNNLITKIPNDFFVPTESLEIFNISHNNLRNPNTDTFYSLKSLKVLDISYNRISTIDLGVLDVMKDLEQLYVSTNALFSIDLGVLDELAHLKVVDLSYNDIKDIPLGLFDRSRKITSINLSGNPFTSIRLGTYDSLKDIVDMKLTNCMISKLPSGIFDQNKHLRYLDLSYNNIETFTSYFFANNENLEYLNVSHNVLKSLPKKIFEKTVLKVLDISYNRLETITNNVLNLKTLNEVYARNNDIYFLDSLTFSTIGYPHGHIDLRYNRLVYLDELFFEYLTNLERMEIIGNPWDCKCLLELQALMRRRYIEYSHEDYFNGAKPVCVAGVKKCQDAHNLDMNKLKMYYKIFVDKQLQ